AEPGEAPGAGVSGFRLALVQPLAHRPPDDERTVADAVRHVEAAAREGAQVVAFPETYPGPWRMPMRFDPTPALADAARRCGVYVQFGTLEPLEAGGRRAHNVLRLARPAGGPPDCYRRAPPPRPRDYTRRGPPGPPGPGGGPLPRFPP